MFVVLLFSFLSVFFSFFFLEGGGWEHVLYFMVITVISMKITLPEWSYSLLAWNNPLAPRYNPPQKTVNPIVFCASTNKSGGHFSPWPLRGLYLKDGPICHLRRLQRQLWSDIPRRLRRRLNVGRVFVALVFGGSGVWTDMGMMFNSRPFGGHDLGGVYATSYL